MLFSIITVSYNSAETIERTIVSVLNQSFQDFEFIIIDGASTDGTLSIVEKYKSRFNGRLICISEKDQGIYDAMNKGIVISKGDVIGIVNSDDWLEPNALEVVSKHLIGKDFFIPLIISGAMNFHYKDGDNQILGNTYSRFLSKSLKYEMGLRHPATFVTKSTYGFIGLFNLDYKISADRDFVLRSFKKGVHVEIIDDILSNMSDGGISNSLAIRSEIEEYSKQLKCYETSMIKRVLLKSRFSIKLILKKYLFGTMIRNFR